MKRVKRKISSLEDFDCRAPIFRGEGELLCVSPLLDPQYQDQAPQLSQQSFASNLLDATSSKATMSAFRNFGGQRKVS